MDYVSSFFRCIKKKLFMKDALCWMVGVMLMAILAVSCGTRPQPLTRAEVPTAVPEEEPEYTLRYGDVVEVKFFYNPELNETVVVRPDGRITVPKMGDVRVVGLTPMQVDSLVTEGLSKSLREPEVSVIVRELGVQNVYVLGEVGAPGEYALTRGMTTLQALARAGGILNTAESKSVMLVRRDPTGRPVAQRLNLTGEALESGREVDPSLEPLDIVYVPKTFIAQVDLFLDQHFAKLLPPLYLYLAGYDVLYPERGRR